MVEENKKDVLLKNSSASTPAHLLASVLEQRYAHKSNTVIKGKDEKPDPMTFPAVQKALGSMYSTIVEIVEEQDEEEISNEVLSDEADETSAQAIENARGLNERLLDMVNEIEQNDRIREEERKAVTVEVQKKKDDPYNRELNSYLEPPEEINTIDISDEIDIETIVSRVPKKRNKRFRNEA